MLKKRFDFKILILGWPKRSFFVNKSLEKPVFLNLLKKKGEGFWGILESAKRIFFWKRFFLGIKKGELIGFFKIWNWGKRGGKLVKPYPSKILGIWLNWGWVLIWLRWLKFSPKTLLIGKRI